jgi:hypothetical protein
MKYSLFAIILLTAVRGSHRMDFNPAFSVYETIEKQRPDVERQK